MPSARWFVVALVLSGCLGADAPAAYSERLSVFEAVILGAPFPRLLLEVDYVEGRSPTPEALRALQETILAVTEKTEVEILAPTPLPPDERFVAGYDWSPIELRELHLASFDHVAPSGYGGAGAARLHILYLSGTQQSAPSTMGLVPQHAIGLSFDDAIVVFPDDLPADPQPGEWVPWRFHMERHVLIHEFGHAIGLVDNGLPMVRPHAAEDGQHSANPESVMAQGSWGGPAFALEDAQPNAWIPYRFDADDLADIMAFREAARGR